MWYRISDLLALCTSKSRCCEQECNRRLFAYRANVHLLSYYGSPVLSDIRLRTVEDRSNSVWTLCTIRGTVTGRC